jgi:RNA polymerase sigma-70 factor (ECF subfamily)
MGLARPLLRPLAMDDAALHFLADHPRWDPSEAARCEPTRRGDRALFAREVLAHRGELLAAALRLSGARAEAEDLVQDAILRAWIFFERFEPGTNGRAWMHRILFRTFVDRYRRRRREREVLGEVFRHELHAAEQALASGLPTERLSDEVERAIETLRPDFREVLELVDLEGKSYRDAAQQVGCPVGTVMSRLHRARRAMKEQLSGYALEHGLGRVTEREAA